jgi:hypothetical protein
MKYIGFLFIVVLVFAIMLGGTYHQQEIVSTTIHLIPTSTAQPELVESALAECNGIHFVRLWSEENQLDITFDKARISLDDLTHRLVALGYQAVAPELAKVSAAI